MSEPRCCLKNRKTQKFLSAKSDWKGGLADSYTGENESFKFQWCKRGDNGIPSCTLIRTDTHPQSLLDVTDLYFEGGALDFSKCDNQNRWWDIIPMMIEKRDDEPEQLNYIIALRSATTGKYLVDSGNNLTLRDLDKGTDMKNVPDMFKWELFVSGRALSPGQVTGIAFAPVVIAIGAATGGAAFLAFGAGIGIAAAGTTGAAIAVTVGAFAGGLATLSGEMAVILKDVSKIMFVDW